MQALSLFNQPSFRIATSAPQKLGVTNGLNYARVNFGVAFRRNLNALWIDVASASHAGITNQTFPSQRCDLLSLNSRESQYLFLKLNDRVHGVQYNESG